MCENVKTKCACDIGYDKGVLKKTLENNIFTIFGNLSQKSSIVIRYHGILTENNDKKFNMFYYFDSMESNKKTVPLDRCTKSIGECYCAVIDLENYNNLHFGFMDENENYDINSNKAFELPISVDPIANLMQRYGFEKNKNLPTCEPKEQPTLNNFKNIIESIKSFFYNILGKIKTDKVSL